MNTTKDQAIGFAMSDIGLTALEAENAYGDMFPYGDTINPCYMCGVEVDDLDSECCVPCHAEWLKTHPQCM